MHLRNLLATIIGGSLALLSASVSAWSVEGNFDDKSVGALCAPIWDSGSDTKVSSDMSSSGTKSCRMGINQGVFTWGGGIKFPSSLAEGDELWVRFRLFVPNGFSTYVPPSKGSNLKFIRISQKDSSGKVGRLDWYWPKGVILERDFGCNPCWQTFNGSSPVTGVWQTWEMYTRLDKISVNDGGQGRTRAWVNGKLVADLTARPTMWPDARTVVDVRIFDHWNGGAPKNQYLYLDDLVVTNVTPASRDTAGNPYIGVGKFITVAPPLPPLVQ